MNNFKIVNIDYLFAIKITNNNYLTIFQMKKRFALTEDESFGLVYQYSGSCYLNDEYVINFLCKSDAINFIEEVLVPYEIAVTLCKG